jgi:hypothetical protein
MKEMKAKFYNSNYIKVPDDSTSQMSFEGNLVRGQQAIVEKLKVNDYSDYFFILYFCLTC